MQHVNKRWLKLFTYGLIAFNSALILGYALMELLSASQEVKAFWGITSGAVIFCVINIIYLATIYPPIAKRSPWIATAISYAMNGVLLALLIETSGQSNNLYRVGTGLLLFLSMMNGIFTAIAGLALIWLLYIFTMVSLVEPSKTSTLFYTLTNIIYTLVAVLGWRLFSPHYEEPESPQLAKVSGLLEQEQFKASLILESITDGVMIINQQGAIQLLNNSGADMLGWPKSEAAGLDYRTTFTPLEQGNTADADSLKTAIALCLETGKSAQKVGLFKTKSKESVYFDIVASPIVEPKSDKSETPSLGGVIAVFRDVSAARNEEHRRADFISTASHEMRTPVAAIEGYLALALNSKLSTIDDKAREYLTKAHQNTQHLGELFQDLLTTTKAEDGRLVNHPEVVEMSEYIEQLVNDLRFVAEKKGLQVDFAAGTETGNKVIKPLYYTMVDPLRIHEVITNLFDNAVKYTESGKITLGITGDQNIVQCFIKDTGNGIPPEDAKHLFQKFYRVDNTATRTIGGTGLGLFICRKIVELYGGRIWVESIVGTGSTFYINLPRMTAQQAEQARQKSVSAPTAEPESPGIVTPQDTPAGQAS